MKLSRISILNDGSYWVNACRSVEGIISELNGISIALPDWYHLSFDTSQLRANIES